MPSPSPAARVLLTKSYPAAVSRLPSRSGCRRNRYPAPLPPPARARAARPPPAPATAPAAGSAATATGRRLRPRRRTARGRLPRGSTDRRGPAPVPATMPPAPPPTPPTSRRTPRPWSRGPSGCANPAPAVATDETIAPTDARGGTARRRGTPARRRHRARRPRSTPITADWRIREAIRNDAPTPSKRAVADVKRPKRPARHRKRAPPPRPPEQTQGQNATPRETGMARRTLRHFARRYGAAWVIRAARRICSTHSATPAWPVSMVQSAEPGGS